MRIDVREALRVVQERFDLSGEAIRMTANLFEYVDGHDVTDPRGLMLAVLDGYGFEEKDLDDMVSMGCITC